MRFPQNKALPQIGMTCGVFLFFDESFKPRISDYEH